MYNLYYIFYAIEAHRDSWAPGVTDFNRLAGDSYGT